MEGIVNVEKKNMRIRQWNLTKDKVLLLILHMVI